jgi:hypothetical protein
MERILTLLMVIGTLAIGCSSPKVTRYETTAYQSASPEIRMRIEEGAIGVGMSVEECKASCLECRFVRKFTSTNGDYELWEVTGREKDLYLHVQNGRIVKVSENTPPLPSNKRHDENDQFFKKRRL